MDDELTLKRIAKGNGGIPSGGVIIGGREYRLTISRAHDQNLHIISRMLNHTPREQAQYLLQWAIERASWEVGTGLAVSHLLIHHVL